MIPSSRRARAAIPLRPHAGIALAVALAAMLAACSSASGGAATPAAPPTAAPTAAPSATPAPPVATPVPAFPVTVTDDEDAAVTIPARPERIVSLTPAVTETLFALGAGERLVANTDFDDHPAVVKDLPHVASYTGVDVEKVVGLEPDLVIAGGNGFNPPEAIAKLRSLGIPVVVVYADSVEGILRDIELVGTTVGSGEAAASLTAWMRERIDAVAAVASAGATAAGAPRVFYELDATNEIYGPAPGSFIAAMVELAGGDPITTGDPAVFAIPLETLVAADPQVIVLGDALYGTTPEAVAQRPGWAAMTAVKDGAVRPVDDTIVTRPGPRIVDGLRALALAIDPTLEIPEVGSPPSLPAP
ncbi:MAG: helical backbone metal receptor [Chloroflexi bacterium]|nr:helical backbone metal receptor [Chloroflexota bacterium]